MKRPAHVVIVTTEVVHRITRKALHEENVAVIIPNEKHYFDQAGVVRFDDHEGIAHGVKVKMLALLYARDSMSASNPVRAVREKINMHPHYLDALVIRSETYECYIELLQKQPEWEVDCKGPIFDGFFNIHECG